MIKFWQPKHIAFILGLIGISGANAHSDIPVEPIIEEENNDRDRCDIVDDIPVTKDSIPNDSPEVRDSTAVDKSAEETEIPKKKGFFSKIISYFDNSNKPKNDKDFDISFLGGPHYSNDTKFGIGLVAAGIYHTDTVETRPSEVSLYFDGTTSGFFLLGVGGTHISAGDRWRINSDINVSLVNSKFWGIGYANNIVNSNVSTYDYWEVKASFSWLWHISRGMYLGPLFKIDYTKAKNLQKPWLWQGESREIFNLGIGSTIEYDTRDNLTYPHNGIYAKIEQSFSPRFIKNKYAFSYTDMMINFYHGVWKGGILAYRLHGQFSYGNTPWNLLPSLGGSYDMRGYFARRFRDKAATDFCVELRQHVWRRNGLTAWVGAGSIFHRLKELKMKEVLPNYGIGYRWEFKKNVNVRLDLGFGKDQWGFVFNINEAF